jgi:DNA-binding beta-propeller fold protein YncE
MDGSALPPGSRMYNPLGRDSRGPSFVFLSKRSDVHSFPLRFRMKAKFLAAFSAVLLAAPAAPFAQMINLPTSKQLLGQIPGNPRRINGLPISMAVSPDGRYVVTVNAGYGTYESRYEQSLTVLDTQTDTITDFPDARTPLRAKQTLYSGLAFSPDGSRIYASMASLTEPMGNYTDAVGSGIAVYTFTDGKIAPDHLIHLPMESLAPGRHTLLPAGKSGHMGVPYPAAIAVLTMNGREKLLVADNLSDFVVLLDAATGAVEERFDLSESDAVPSTYPVALAVAKDGRHAYVALWNASEIAELNLASATVDRKLDMLKPTSDTAPGTHPCALVLAPDGKTLYVSLANRDTVAAVNLASGQFSIKGYFDTRLPGQTYFGAEPVALALNQNGTRLYAADMASDAVAVFDTRKLTPKSAPTGMVLPDGFIPTDWLPISMAFDALPQGGRLFVATGKGTGTGPNNFPQRPADSPAGSILHGGSSYIGTLLHGSLAGIDESAIENDLPQWTPVVLDSNLMIAAQRKIDFAGNRPDPIKHVIYIIKENRAYDQIFGDLEQNGKPVGNGDPSLTMYGEAITPNEHKLALQFGVLDNFYDSGEVSGDGHVWSTAGIGTDYLEKNWQENYRGDERPYDFEGVVADGIPLLEKIPDVNEPASGYLWGNMAAHGKTYYHFGEYISSAFCNETAVADPKLGTMLAGPKCAHKEYMPGETLPEAWGGGVNKWPWPIPALAANVATKPELVGHFDPDAPDFNLRVPDQIRVDVFLRHFKEWVADLAQGQDTMPNFILLRLPDDHTAGTRPGWPTPRASVADNDLAVGRAVEAVSHSPFWDNTAFFILEDDAQNGADHVDAHRSIALVVSRYAPHGAHGEPFVDDRFYTTVSEVRTMEALLGLPPMNNDDAFCSLMADLFTGPGDQPPYDADYSNRDNGLIYTANAKNAEGARASMKMDFSHEDRAPVEKLNVILWKDAMGKAPVPAMLKARSKKDDRDGD